MFKLKKLEKRIYLTVISQLDILKRYLGDKMREFHNKDEYNHEHRHSKHHHGNIGGFGLRYWILTLVSENFVSGSEISDKIENMSMGRWRPSPGQMYPLLENMTNDGYLEIKIDSGKKLYSSTLEGKRVLNESWFPWKAAGGLTSSDGIEGALSNMESLVEYIMDNKEGIQSDVEAKKRVNQIVDRLREI